MESNFLILFSIMNKELYKNELIRRLVHNKMDRENFTAIAAMFDKIIFGSLCVFVFLHMAQQVQAIELTDDIQLHGFLTQGYFLTSDNRLFGTSDKGGSFDYTEAGLTGSWTPSADLRFAAQVLFRRAGEGHENDLDLDFGLLDYTILSTVDYRLGVRLGRFKIPFGLYNDTRDVLFTRPTILLPQSIYADATRDLALSADGGLVYGEYQNAWGNLLLELGMGFPRGGSLDTEFAILGFDFPGNTFSSLSYIGRLSYDLDDGKYRMAISSAWVDTRYDPELLPSDDLFPGKDIFTPVVFSAQYNQEKLSLTAEYAIRPVKDTGFGNGFDKYVIGESYYLQALYRFDKNLQAILRYDAFYNDRNDKDGKKFEAKTLGPAHTQFAKDLTVGFRYYVDPTFLIAAEYHYVNGTVWLVPFQDNPNISDLEQHWHLFALAAGFRF